MHRLLALTPGVLKGIGQGLDINVQRDVIGDTLNAQDRAPVHTFILLLGMNYDLTHITPHAFFSTSNSRPF